MMRSFTKTYIIHCEKTRASHGRIHKHVAFVAVGRDITTVLTGSTRLASMRQPRSSKWTTGAASYRLTYIDSRDTRPTKYSTTN